MGPVPRHNHREHDVSVKKPNPFDLGKQAALERKPCKPPNNLRGGETARWLSGWQAGTVERGNQESAARRAAKEPAR